MGAEQIVVDDASCGLDARISLIVAAPQQFPTGFCVIMPGQHGSGVMRKLAVRTIALAALIAGPATAADLAVKAPLYKAPPAPIIYSWTGFYIGANVGYSWGRSSTDYAVTGLALFSTSQNMNGWLGGGQIGYNFQINRSWLFGIEADIQATGQKGTALLGSVLVCPPPAALALPCTTTTGALEQKLPWFGTLRARAGVLASDSLLLYVTGGLAYGQVNSNLTVTTATAFVGGPVLASAAAVASVNTTKVGWTVGAGAEWVISGPWTAKVEYLYVDLGTVSNTFIGIGAFPIVAASSRVTDNIFRVGINYRFGGPVVARY
jgi:outer membrane immunogenic protein